MSENLKAASPKPRLAVMDIIKGLGILGVVLVHSYCPVSGIFTLYIIVVFFMASGFFWNEKHTHTWKDAGALVLKRFKDLFIPYLIVKAVYLLLRNIFVAIHFLPQETAVSISDIPLLAYTVITCGKTDAGPQFNSFFSLTLWFLALLFFVYVVHIIICRIFDRFVQTPKKRAVFYAVLIAAALIMLSISLNILKMPWLIRLFACYVSFLFGIPAKMIFDKADLEKVRTYVWVLVTIGAFGALIAVFVITGCTIDVAKGELHGTLFFCVCGLLGYIANFALAVLISRGKKGKLARLLSYIGTNTKPIMITHILFFKPVVLLYILIFAKPIEYLEMFPVIMDESFLFMWLIYAPFGTAMSLLIDKPYQSLKKLIFKPNKA